MDANAQMELMEQHLLFHKAMAEDEESFKRINGYLEVLHEENTGEQLSDSVDESIRSVFSLVLEKGMDPWAINLEEFAR
ncbi:MAG: chromosome segregation protein ScpA, partial [Candidatus Methanomethylophilus sp.]|nr:chromosome segregation protein ScpA [Methanomethylophilus sp.]